MVPKTMSNCERQGSAAKSHNRSEGTERRCGRFRRVIIQHEIAFETNILKSALTRITCDSLEKLLPKGRFHVRQRSDTQSCTSTPYDGDCSKHIKPPRLILDHLVMAKEMDPRRHLKAGQAASLMDDSLKGV